MFKEQSSNFSRARFSDFMKRFWQKVSDPVLSGTSGMKEVACHLGFPTFSALSVSERSSRLKAANPSKASLQIQTVFQARVVLTQPSVHKVSYCHCLGTSVLFLLWWRYTDRRSLQRLAPSSEGAGEPAREAGWKAEGGDGASRLPRRDRRRHGGLLPCCLAPAA